MSLTLQHLATFGNHWNIFGNLQQCSEVKEHLQQCSEVVRNFSVTDLTKEKLGGILSTLNIQPHRIVRDIQIDASPLPTSSPQVFNVI